MTNETVKSLVAYCRVGGRVCPMPQRWNELYNLLPERRQVGAGWEPPLPLILMASYESDMSKMNRLQVHIEWAAAHDALHQVADYLRGLPEEEWFHIGG